MGASFGAAALSTAAIHAGRSAERSLANLFGIDLAKP